MPIAAAALTAEAGEEEGSGDQHAEWAAKAHDEDREHQETAEAARDAASTVETVTHTSCCHATCWVLCLLLLLLRLRCSLLCRAQQASNQSRLQGSVLIIHAHCRNGRKRHACRAAPTPERIDRPHNESADRAEEPENTVGAEDEKRRHEASPQHVANEVSHAFVAVTA